ncbi:hypothetical protein ACQP00_23670 [Dactylosporangium sp. CS-047395]|uniref:hypothetical protein n=1 Tax=Dactylosporangium sp. CS-047395 TaxID=3239936 RepID=UPI003D8B531B
MVEPAPAPAIYERVPPSAVAEALAEAAALIAESERIHRRSLQLRNAARTRDRHRAGESPAVPD